jgi:L,D-transpeptidase ErfK/SrfK
MRFKLMTGYKIFFSSLTALLICSPVFATAYIKPVPDESLIGQLQYNTTGQNDDITSIQKHYDVGYNALENANPHLDPTKMFPPAATVTIPTQHILPNQPREGIVINLPEMRMYYYPPESDEVFTYPIGIGKIGKTIPITKTIITRKALDPIWVPPEDIREFNLKQGIVLPHIMPAGPENPLGPYAIYMRIPTYLIHSTIYPESIGKRASFGCIRMYETDIKDFFPSVEKRMPVIIINNPIKIGWDNEHLFLEAHKPLKEHDSAYDASLPGTVNLINQESKNNLTLVDWQSIAFILEERDGIPHEIGLRIHSSS